MSQLINELLPHQYDTVEYLEQNCINQKGLLIYHYLGTGKTLSGLVWLTIIMTIKSSDYLIVCPELLKSNWMDEAKKINFNLIPSKIINYDDLRLMIENNSPKIKNTYLILDEVHHIINIIRNLITNKKYYLEINSYLTSTKKNLLLSATPFTKIYDLSILINLCSEKPFMPIDEITFYEKYNKVDKSQIEKNINNPIYFNYIKPIVYKSSSWVLNNVIEPVISSTGLQNPSINQIAWQFMLIPFQFLIADKINYNIFNFRKYFDIIDKYFGRINIVKKVIRFFDEKDLMLKELQYQKDLMKGTPKFEMLKEALTIGFTLLLGYLIWMLINSLWDKLINNFKGPSNRIPSKNNTSNVDIKKISSEIQQYVSYYKYEDYDDYANVNYIKIPIITILSSFSIVLTIQYYLGKISTKLFSFISKRPIEDIELDKTLLTDDLGFQIYGRCLSNLPDFIDEIIVNKNNFKIDPITGVVSIDYIKDEEIIFKSSTKIQNIGDYLIKLNGKKKILIYSDYLEQGTYLLSIYLNSKKIKHLYLNTSLSLKNRSLLLDTFNKDFTYTVIILDSESKEGINLFNIEEVHFLEPPINSGIKDQVVGRAIRYQSHKDLPLDRREVKIYIHMSSLFSSEKDKVDFITKLKTTRITNIFYDFLMDIYKKYNDDWKIKGIIQKMKKEEFNGVLQTTFHPYLDKLLNLELITTAQGKLLNSKRKYSTETGIKESTRKVVLSIDEHCYQSIFYNDYYIDTLRTELNKTSILSPDFKIEPRFNCIKKTIPLNISFKRKTKSLGTIKKKN